jgi:hypothetical protein
MTEKPQTDPEVPHDDELDVEAPNESAPGHNPPDEDGDADDGGDDAAQ